MFLFFLENFKYCKWPNIENNYTILVTLILPSDAPLRIIVCYLLSKEEKKK